jgi:hypothetical protein
VRCENHEQNNKAQAKRVKKREREREKGRNREKIKSTNSLKTNISSTTPSNQHKMQK